jgi:6-pyruvoyltetrahydropterin/6-carboxytetrahydropterin synthase
MYELMVELSFDAAHQIAGSGGRCERLHGHTWQVEVFVQGKELDEEGLLIDFAELKKIVNRYVGKLDHRYINEALPGMNPTTENIARYLFQKVQGDIDSDRLGVSRVRVWEARDACATYQEDRNP